MFIHYTKKNAPVIYTDTVFYLSYMFRRHLRNPQGAVHQDLKRTKILKYNRLQK
jgi:hypothetical protein